MRLAAPALGLLVFGAMILRGLVAGNPPETVLVRALWGLVAGVLLGSLAGSIAQHVIRDRRDPPTSHSTGNGEAATGGGVAATGA